jgi:hypothetical protein
MQAKKKLATIIHKDCIGLAQPNRQPAFFAAAGSDGMKGKKGYSSRFPFKGRLAIDRKAHLELFSAV